MKTLIQNADIVTKNQVLYGGFCLIEDGIILKVGGARVAGEESTPVKEADCVIDAKGHYLIPGFIDLHCHGGGGYDFMDACVEEIGKIADYHLAHGTTSLLATTLAGDPAETEAALDTYLAFSKENTVTSLCGVHMEGPWLNPLQCGAQNVEYMKIPKKGELAALKEKYPFLMRVSAAPELDGAMEFGEEGQSLGILMSPAHTDADFATIGEALHHGYRLMTHHYSGMKGVTRKNSYRIAGAVEGGLYFDDCYVEIIADGKHLPEELLKFIYKCKGPDRICLTTDATRAAGLPDGSTSILGSLKNGFEIIIEDGVAKLPDRQSFAGSVATADRLYRTMAKAIGQDMVALSRMASLTPAAVMGWTDRGEIAVGKRADLVLLDRDLNVQKVFFQRSFQEEVVKISTKHK